MPPKASKWRRILNHWKGLFISERPTSTSEGEENSARDIAGRTCPPTAGHSRGVVLAPQCLDRQSEDLTHSLDSTDREAQTHLKPDNGMFRAGDAIPHKATSTQRVTHVMIQGGSGHIFNNSTFIQNNGRRDEAPVKDVLDQFPTNNFRYIHPDPFESATAQTGSWFLDSEEFQGWADSEGGMLWGVAIPGAGKTFLSSIVINHLEGHAKPGISIAFVYCRYSDEVTLVEVLTALVRQQLERDASLADVIRPILARHNHENTTPSSSDLLNILNDVAQRSNRTFYIIDALDELPKDVCSKVLQALASINANIFLTSRPLESMKAFTPNARYVDIAAHPHDIALFVADKIATNPDFGTLLNENGVRDEVITSIVKKCAGRFLHASLQVETFRHCCSLAELEETMEKLPEGVEELYKADLKRIGDQPKRRAALAKLALVWVINVARSITFEELQCALSFSENTKAFNPKDTVTESLLLSICCGLVAVEKESRLVRLVHFTAKEVLQPLLAHDYPTPDSVIADACISRLIQCKFQESTTITTRLDLLRSYNQNPLLEYAHNFWAAHTLRCDISTAIRKRAAEFIKQCHSFPSNLSDPIHWLNVVDKFSNLHVAASYNFVDVDLESLLENSRCHSGEFCDVNSRTVQGHTPLTLACRTGSTRAVRWLLDVVGILVDFKDLEGMTALIQASRYGHEGIVRILLRVAGIDANLANMYGWTPLMYASASGHEAIVRILLDSAGIDINLVNRAGRTALMHACTRGHEGVVRILLDAAGILANLGTPWGSTALKLATEYAPESISKVLLRVPGIETHFTDRDGDTSLMFASDRGFEETVYLILQTPGHSVNAATHLEGWTALMIAASQSREGVVRMLLTAPDIEVDAVDKYGCTVIEWASIFGHEGVVKLLNDYYSSHV